MPPNQTATVNGLLTPSSTGPEAPRPRRARTSRPKVKTGCFHCKRRRIKCDEQRPSCSQCRRASYECRGYPAPPRTALTQRIPLAPRPVLANPSHLGLGLPGDDAGSGFASGGRNTPPQTPRPLEMTILHEPSIRLPFDRQETLYFQVFQEGTARELSGFFDSVFWTRTVLQECHSQDAIRHAVLALGALYKTLEKSTESPPSSPSEESHPGDTASRHWEVAVKQYSNAITSLVGASTPDQETHRTRLMASVLLACFDSFIGDHKQAIIQIQAGLALLEQLRRERREAFMPKPEEPVEDELIQMFTRLAIQAKSYDMAFHFPKPYVIHLIQQSPDPASPASDAGSPVSLHQQPIPEHFSSLMEARVAWDTLCEKIFRFTETMFNHVSSSGPPNILPTSLTRYGQEFRQQIAAWSAAFDHILHSRTAPGVTGQEKAAIAVLKMFQIMGQILFLMTFGEKESQFDAFRPHFQAIVDYASEVVGDEERRAAARRCPDPATCQHRLFYQPDIFGGHSYSACHLKPSFSADLGIVPPLYVVATKCRHPIIRRQAIQLLRSSSRREGMWDSELMARIAMWIAEIEEERDDDDYHHHHHHMLSPASAGDTATLSRPSTGGSGGPPAMMNGSSASAAAELGTETPLGPGGNARWDLRRQSQALDTPIPESRRIMIKAAEFDLREHTAIIRCGTRGLAAGTQDLKTRVKKITW